MDQKDRDPEESQRFAASRLTEKTLLDKNTNDFVRELLVSRETELSRRSKKDHESDNHKGPHHVDGDMLLTLALRQQAIAAYLLQVGKQSSSHLSMHEKKELDNALQWIMERRCRWSNDSNREETTIKILYDILDGFEKQAILNKEKGEQIQQLVARVESLEQSQRLSWWVSLGGMIIGPIIKLLRSSRQKAGAAWVAVRRRWPPRVAETVADSVSHKTDVA